MGSARTMPLNFFGSAGRRTRTRVVYGLPWAVPETKYSFTMYLKYGRSSFAGRRCNAAYTGPGPVTSLEVGIGVVCAASITASTVGMSRLVIGRHDSCSYAIPPRSRQVMMSAFINRYAGGSKMSDFPARAKRVGELANEHAEAGDKNGRLSDPVVAALHREGLYGIWVPQALGGAELRPIESLQVIENLAYGDPSTGWVLMAAALAIGSGAAYLKDPAIQEMFGGKQFPVIAGQGTRPGNAVPVDGGYRLTGSWSFASGIKHGTHIHTLGIIEGTGEPRIFVLPVGQANLVDNWDVMGLRGTGSIDYTIDSVYVPDSYTHFAVTDVPKRGGSLYSVGIVGFAAMCHSGWACGIGRRLLDESAATVRARGGRAGTRSTSESFLEQYAKAEGTYRS